MLGRADALDKQVVAPPSQKNQFDHCVAQGAQQVHQKWNLLID